MEDKIKALESNDTWILSKLPHEKKPVGYKWIFTVKYKADGNVKRYKAYLVAQGLHIVIWN